MTRTPGRQRPTQAAGRVRFITEGSGAGLHFGHDFW